MFEWDLTAVDYLGMVGSFLIAGAYFAVSAKHVDPDRPPFHIINLLGALFILVSLYYRPNAGAIMIEVLWVAIAVYALAKYMIKRR